ncbi:hypothetical protein [Kitasatospora sp. NRRL B-11411]|uniref:hypothetical protein n=1 Tax=Kitasatospora sp. NRRL B-11411 TaxID=1463822 RepID=UPI0004C358DC|nr:hypothetical protein [Kitasatospora sp. NRRL B-11411]
MTADTTAGESMSGRSENSATAAARHLPPSLLVAGPTRTPAGRWCTVRPPWRRAARRLVLALALLPLLTAPAAPARGHMVHGTVFSKDATVIHVRPGQLFSLHWHLAVAPGTDHRPTDPLPDLDVLVFVGADEVPPRGWIETMGDGGDLYLVLKARHPGTTTLNIANCFDCWPGYGSSYHEHNTYRIVVG